MCKDMFKTIKYENKSINEICEHIDNDFNNLVSIIDAFNGVIDRPINKKDLESFPFMIWQNLGGGVWVRKRNNRFGNLLNFDTKMIPSEAEDGEPKFGDHFHDDIIESCEIVEGWLKDRRVPKAKYVKGDVVNWHKGERHEPFTKVYTFLHVLFKP